MALAERWLAARFNRPGHEIVDHRTYALCSDGDMMEGISHEAAALAGHQKLGKLTWIFDDNRITIDGATDLSTSTDHAERFRAYGWHVQHVADGNDLDAIDAAIEAAKAETERPSFIVLRTTIAWGSPHKAGTSAAHGSALGEDEVEATKKNLGYPSLEPFWVDPEARAHWAECIERGEGLESAWHERFEAYQAEHPDLAAEFLRMMAGDLPEEWDADLPDLSSVEKADATRNWSGKVIQGLAARVPNLVGGSADLAGSNKTDIDGADDLLPDTPCGRNVRYGIREHAMGAVMNGMSLHGGVRPFGGTFLIFSDYMRPAIRLAALMGQPVVYVFSHDSIGLGEDGPTHQPVEQLAALRAVPNLDGPSPRGRCRDRGRVAGGHGALRRTDLPRAQPAEGGDARPLRSARFRRGAAARRLRARGGIGKRAVGDSHRQRQRGGAGARGQGEARGRGQGDPRGQPAELAPVRTTGRASTATRSCRRTCPRASPSRRQPRSDGTAGSARRAEPWDSTTSARRLRPRSFSRSSALPWTRSSKPRREL